MSTFNYSDYQKIAAQEQETNNSAKVSYFKLKDDGDIAIARINLSSTDEFMFAAVHTLQVGGKWMKVSCLNPLGANNGACPLCSAHNANPKGSISKAAKKMFIPMMVSYRDPNSATGYTTPIPVVWDRPAAFSRELANKLMIAGDLRNTLVLITRNGKAGDMQTTYSMDILPADHPVFKPDMIPVDFSAFTNFNIAKHSYWEKTVEEINTFLTTGQFPEVAKANNQQPAPTAVNTAGAYSAPATAAVPSYSAPAAAPVATNPGVVTQQPFVPPATSTAAPAVSADPNANTAAPARNFSGFSF
jgi:hypothetical protein